jgi:alkanesulfonate monooxygenase SsuD/methylene tetrahydromethanopterin reductase-like flavin-dependent oxidoreductase (luciferase family)
VRLSIWPNAQQPWTDLLDEVRHAERTGWDGVYLADHFMGDGGGFGAPEVPNLEATAALAALGAATERLRIGPLVLGNTYRHPAVVAKWAVTLDHITGGRAVLGIGAGWQQNEHDQYGIELPAPGQRVSRLDEACRAITALLSEPRTTMHGEHYVLRDALSEPKPVQERLPLLVGGKGDRMLGLVARHADEWNMWGLPPVIAERTRVLERRCEAIGRDPSTIRRSTQALVMVTEDGERARRFVEAVAPRAAVAGPPERFAEVVQGWAGFGIDEVIVPDGALGTGQERLERLDALRGAVTGEN